MTASQLEWLTWVQTVAAVLALVFAVTGPLRVDIVGALQRRKRARRESRESRLVVEALVRPARPSPLGLEPAWLRDSRFAAPALAALIAIAGTSVYLIASTLIWADQGWSVGSTYTSAIGGLIALWFVGLAAADLREGTDRVSFAILLFIPLALVFAVLRNVWDVRAFELADFWPAILLVSLARWGRRPGWAAVLTVGAAGFSVGLSYYGYSHRDALMLCLVIGALWQVRLLSENNRWSSVFFAGLFAASIVLPYMTSSFARARVVAWLEKSPASSQGSGWELDSFRLVFGDSRPFGMGDATHLERLTSPAEIGWPITLATSVGIVPMIAFTLLYAFTLVVLLRLAAPGSRLPAIVLSCLFVVNILVVLGALPTFGVVAAGFGGGMQIGGGGAILALAISAMRHPRQVIASTISP